MTFNYWIYWNKLASDISLLCKFYNIPWILHKSLKVIGQDSVCAFRVYDCPFTIYFISVLILSNKELFHKNIPSIIILSIDDLTNLYSIITLLLLELRTYDYCVIFRFQHDFHERESLKEETLVFVI